jgi:hypothetical protein
MVQRKPGQDVVVIDSLALEHEPLHGRHNPTQRLQQNSSSNQAKPSYAVIAVLQRSLHSTRHRPGGHLSSEKQDRSSHKVRGQQRRSAVDTRRVLSLEEYQLTPWGATAL